jgi:serine/threonine-protein kinase
VTITNETGYNLETGLTTGQINTQISPGGSYTMNNVPKNSDLVINSIGRASVLDYRIDVQDNTVYVTVKTAAGVAGDNAINIQDTGAIFIY